MILEILPQSAGINHTSQREAYLLVLSKTIAESQCHNCDGACCFLTSHMIGDPPRKESPQRGTVGDLKAWYALLCAPLCHRHHLVTVSPLLKSPKVRRALTIVLSLVTSLSLVFLFSSLSCSPSWWRSSLTSFQPSSTPRTTSWASWRSLQPHVESVKHDKTSINSQSTPLSSLRRTLRSSSPWISLCSWLHRSHQRLRSSWRAIVAFLERLRLLAKADFTMAAEIL
jgi:hypothetical protein